jgi:hypothetical protein
MIHISFPQVVQNLETVLRFVIVTFDLCINTKTAWLEQAVVLFQRLVVQWIESHQLRCRCEFNPHRDIIYNASL